MRLGQNLLVLIKKRRVLDMGNVTSDRAIVIDIIILERRGLVSESTAGIRHKILFKNWF